MHNFYEGQAVKHIIYGDGVIRGIYENANGETCYDILFSGLGRTIAVMDETALTPKIPNPKAMRNPLGRILGISDNDFEEMSKTIDKALKEEEKKQTSKKGKIIDGGSVGLKDEALSAKARKNTPNEEDSPLLDQAAKHGFHGIKKSYDGVAHHHDIVMGLNKLYAKKNADYGDSFHLSYLEEGMAMARIRLSDKLNRFKALTKNGSQQVKDESIRDTLLDLANYAILTVMELDREAENV